MNRLSKGVSKLANVAVIDKAALQEWFDEARRILIDEGITELSLRKLSASLGVTTGYFYRRFTNFEEFLDAFREYWAAKGMMPFNAIYKDNSLSPLRQYLAHARGLVLENSFDYKFDMAIRDWAGSSEKTRSIMEAVEGKRVMLIASSLERMGYSPNEAKVRARTYYLHQTGYQAMRIQEPLNERLDNLRYYAKILTGYDVFSGCKTTSDIRQVLSSGVPLFGDDQSAPRA